MRTIAIFPGRFQPAHLGHLSVYDHLVKKFGADNVFIATSDKVAPLTSPFTFADKVEMWTHLGVPASKIVRVRSPYNPREITDEVPDPENTALVMAISEKDMAGEGARFKFGTKRDGSPSYMQPYTDGKLEPMSEHAYVLTIPTTTFNVQGTDANSATQIRDTFIKGNANKRRAIVHDLYGVDDPALLKTFDQRLAVTEDTSRIINEARHSVNTLDRGTRHKIRSLIESVRRLERDVRDVVFTEDLVENYFKER